uniref:Uncharacterized protein n=1 Tax=Anguilla anguilla TaxID=7936 RepID=A0A0E9QPB4_ANGAN
MEHLEKFIWQIHFIIFLFSAKQHVH